MDAKGYSALGASLYRSGRLQEALAAFDSALALDPKSALDLLNRGSVLGDMGQYDDALIALRLAEQIGGESPALAGHVKRFLWSVLARYGTECGQLGEAEKSRLLLDEALRMVPDDLPTAMSRTMALNYLPGVAPQTIRAEAEEFGQMVARLGGPPRKHIAPTLPVERLRVGFVSADFRKHPVARFLSPLGRLDSARFELYAYDNTRGPDEVTGEFKRALPNWRDITTLSDATATDLIASDGIHVLVDLSGLSAGGRMGIFARKPAPVQVTWLGYFATTGLATMDYVLASEAVLPKTDEAHWRERPWRLPHTYLAFAPPLDGPAVRESPAIRNGYVTFGSFNNLRKLTPETLVNWAEILVRVPKSRLELRSSSRRISSARVDEVLEVFTRRGIARDRVSISPAIQGYAAHLASYSEVDIALDTHPFAGATTTCEALWMGVPVVTRRGDRYVSRMGENILHAIGRPDWIAADATAYVERAVALAIDIPALNAERLSLRERLMTSPIGDLNAFAAALGSAFEGMWAAFRATAG